MNTELWTRVTK